jgi:two-component system sensor histidine kinase DegS
MDAARAGDESRNAHDLRNPADARVDGFRAEASEAVGYSADTLRGVIQRYRTAYTAELARWRVLRDELDALERSGIDQRPRLVALDPNASEPPDDGPAIAAASGADESRLRSLRREVDEVGRDLANGQTDLAKLEIALRSLESISASLERGETTLGGEAGEPVPAEVQVRIIEAQESERSRLAQEVHDGPAQVLSNAIFQVEYIERVIDQDARAARTELRFLRDLLRRELGSVRTFISQLRPAVLDELGLDGAISDAVGRTTALTGLAITTELTAQPDRLSGPQQTVVLRVLQAALQNVRKHGAASAVTVATATEGGDWVLTVQDDGRGFDVEAVAARGRRNFGLQFMRERAELIGAHLEVHSRPDGGTLVKLAIPMGAKETG